MITHRLSDGARRSDRRGARYQRRPLDRDRWAGLSVSESGDLAANRVRQPSPASAEIAAFSPAASSGVIAPTADKTTGILARIHGPRRRMN